MSRSPFRTLTAFVGGMVLSLVVVFAADAAYGHRPAPSAPPVSSPTQSPVVEPTPTPAQPAAAPSERPAGGDIVVALKNLTGDDVSVVIDDATGKLGVVSSGTPGDGMSVRWFDVKVENIDAETLRVVWVGLPRDEVIRLTISEVDGTIQFAFVQEAPPANSDSLGFDRVLELRFDLPVRADDVVTSVNERPAA